MEKAIRRYWPIFVLPTFLAFILGFIAPFAMGVYLSFCKFTTVTDAKFIGFSNYLKIFTDASFVHALWYTAIFTVVTVVLINVLAFAVALLLTKGFRGTNIFRTVFFMPNLIGGIILGYIWQLLLNGVLLYMNRTLTYSSVYGFWGLVILMCWQQIGYMMIIYIAGIQVDINPITEGRTGTLETYLPEVETYLQEKAQQEQTNNQLVTQGRENALEQQPEKEKMIEEKTLSELEKEPVVEPETVHITFTVAECGEFHTMGEFHEGIETIEEAMQLYNVIDPSRMHGIPSLGVNMHIDGTEEWEDEEADIVRGNCIDVDFLNYTPELRDTPTVQDALKKLIAAYPDKEVNDRETKEAKIQTIATELDQLSYDIDTFEYRDSVPDREAQVQMIANDIRSGNVKPLQIFLQTSIDEGIDEDSERQAKELIAKLAEYKPLAKIEELEEQNYNMIDDRLNNGVEKFNREEEKKEQAEKPQARSSLKERLVAKQKEVAQGKKDSKEQEKSKNTHREM